MPSKMMIKLAETKAREKKIMIIQSKMTNQRMMMKVMIKKSKKRRKIRREVKISWVSLK